MKSNESMKLAISNIAFGEDQQAALKCVSQSGVEGLVIAPPIIWSDLPEITNFSERERKDRLKTMERKAREYRERLGGLGLTVVGLQSLTYATKDMALFGSDYERERLAKHLEVQAILAGELGADSMSFGSPALRKLGGRSYEQAMEEAIGLFTRVARTAARNNTQLAIEPLCGYGNEFGITLEQAEDLTCRIADGLETENRLGFGIHPDTAAMHGAGDAPGDLASLVRDHRDRVRGIDASAPELKRLSAAPEVPQGGYMDALRGATYDGWVSIEMRGPLNPKVLKEEIEIFKKQCGLAA
ncbi:TIM barrel protein [Candidatus Saccharibacteria bacterium oral taxon 488]|nr:TIM barrel protein [Candidatus Saccharibacteria bacterium oral taxon 488]